MEAGSETLKCSLRGRVKHDGGTGSVAVGDRVRVERLEDGSCRIHELLPRSSALSRLGVARRREQVIAANVDQVAAVVAAARPEPDLSMLDRLLVLAELNGLTAIVVLNKVDLLEETGASGDTDGATSGGVGGKASRDVSGGTCALAPYADAGYPILRTSARTGHGLDELRERLTGRVTVLTGPSGTGKSSLLNALVPGLGLRIGKVGSRKGRGRHTTVSAALYPFPPRGYVADTPGLQYLALWDVDPARLSDAFPEFREPAESCRFADCRHRAEPDCGVLQAVETEAIPRRRYESYLALLEEAEGGR